ncbi:unnamed protein product [Porites evermanni]|uniref:Uncharacterized protein n=1 Tax=Porites evermanni TaxID=104178 RepID=A0ABN8MH73_9CNID|nr:unnamed protein product [Porites evermanni]
MDSKEKEIPATASQTPGKRSQTSRAVHKLSVSRLLADNKRASVAVSTVTSASESMPIDIETSAYCEDVTSARFKEVAIQCDILHETSIVPLSTSTAECSPVKSLGGRSVDNGKDFDYVPPTDLSLEVSLEDAEDDTEEYEGSPSKLIGKKDPVAPQDEKKYTVFFSCLMELFAGELFFWGMGGLTVQVTAPNMEPLQLLRKE